MVFQFKQKYVDLHEKEFKFVFYFLIGDEFLTKIVKLKKVQQKSGTFLFSFFYRIIGKE